MIAEIIHLIVSTAVIIALWHMGYKDVSSKILITIYIGTSFLFTHYYKKLFKIKIKEVIEREKEIQQDLLENHKLIVDELKTTHWENMNSKQTEVKVYQDETKRLTDINKQINQRYEKLITDLTRVE